jgi:hypothetical protein
MSRELPLRMGGLNHPAQFKFHGGSRDAVIGVSDLRVAMIVREWSGVSRLCPLLSDYREKIMAKKIPQWKTQWDALVGDHKYLDIKGWYDWQEKFYTTDYIRDYYGKDEDPDYGSPAVRVMARWSMDWLRRQRGRMRHTLPNDPHFLVTRMNLHPDDAKWAGSALVLLVECGFLIPTNECVRDQKYGNKTKSNQIKEKESKAFRPSGGEQPEPTIPDEAEGVEEAVTEPVVVKEKTPAEALASQFFKALGQPKKFRHAAGAWEQEMTRLLTHTSQEELSAMIKFALEDDDFILGYLNKAAEPMACFVKNFDSISQSWETEKKVSAARAKKASKSVATKPAPGAHGTKSGFTL